MMMLSSTLYSNINMKISFLLLLTLITSSCFKLSDDSKLNFDTNPSIKNSGRGKTPKKSIVDFRTFVNVDISKKINSKAHIKIKTIDGEILFSGAVFSLKSKSKIELPYAQKKLSISVGENNKTKIVNIKNNLIQVKGF